MSTVPEIIEAFSSCADEWEYYAQTVGSLSADDVIRVRLAHQDAVRRINKVDAEYTKRFCDLGQACAGFLSLVFGEAIVRPEVIVEGKRYFPTVTKEVERYDGPALVSRVAAVSADRYGVDRETGEIVPPAVLAEKVATLTAKVLGGLAPSTKWRSSFLAEVGIDVKPYRSYEPGSSKIGEFDLPSRDLDKRGKSGEAA